MFRESVRFLGIVGLLLTLSGCLPALPENLKATDSPARTTLLETSDSRFETESGLTDGVWLEVNRSDGDGAVGGYLSQNVSPTQSLVIILHGASTFEPEGSVGSARFLHETFGSALRERGFVTWSLAYRECGTPYGQGDLQDVLDAIDWVEQVGYTTLDVKHLYVAGYSTGGTLAILANRNRTLSAVAGLSGLTEPQSLETLRTLFLWLTGNYPFNMAACQMRQTLEFYGPPGAAGWAYLDTVSNVAQLRSPMLVIHGTEDGLFSPRNAYNLEAAYRNAAATGIPLPPMQFLYLDGEGHFLNLMDASVVDPIATFFAAHQAPMGE